VFIQKPLSVIVTDMLNKAIDNEIQLPEKDGQKMPLW
jgi:hypothetical protein